MHFYWSSQECRRLWGCTTKYHRLFHLFFVSFLLVTISVWAQEPTLQTVLTSVQIIEKSTPSVALVLVGKTSYETANAGSALVVRENGVLLTAYHVVKDAQAVQVRFKNGEVFDSVQLLGVDRRRDVAAIRIPANGLPAMPLSDASETKPGDPVWLVSNAGGLPWSASTGVVSSFRLADEVPGAGSGYRVLQFTAPVSAGSSGGVLIDAQGRALGLILGSLTGGQNLNFAVPVKSVAGLIDAPVAQTFGSGANLKFPADSLTRTRNPVPTEPAGSAKAAPQSDDLTRSETLKSDKTFILHNFRTMCVDARNASYFGNNQMKTALVRNQGWAALNITLVDDPSLADVVLVVGYTFVWDYPFTLRHQNTSMVLLAGKGSGPFSGPVGAASVARNLIKLLKPYRGSSEKRN